MQLEIRTCCAHLYGSKIGSLIEFISMGNIKTVFLIYLNEKALKPFNFRLQYIFQGLQYFPVSPLYKIPSHKRGIELTFESKQNFKIYLLLSVFFITCSV